MIFPHKVVKFEDVMKDKQRFLKLFSEGDDNLKETLEYCFDNNISTRGCCKGHSYRKDSYPFIAFDISEDNYDHIRNLFNNLEKDGLVFSFDIGSKLLGPTMYVKCLDEEKKTFFNEVTKSLKERNLMQPKMFLRRSFELFVNSNIKDFGVEDGTLSFNFIFYKNPNKVDLLITTDIKDLQKGINKTKAKKISKNDSTIVYEVNEEETFLDICDIIELKLKK